ncbi:PREDICTED: BRCA1-associated protein [Tarenaya hassleriana]|uniref:BRCA1-associated protein n=1 Tax=Tarenaya hassleriana TaxID=28532 RepID=UPI00053C9077|nr:PREDICTED: BRCA1-associated protein [Tarenaya hassleriana]
MSSSSRTVSGEEGLMAGESSLCDMTQTVRFSSGNPRIGETHGVMHLFSDDSVSSSSSSSCSPSSSSSNLPIGRNPLVCVLGVPNHMTYADFCQFCGSFIQHILEMRTVRNDGIENRYSILIRFDSQEFTDAFYQHFGGKRFSSLEEDVCRVLFTMDVQFTGYSGSIDNTQPSSAGSIEQSTCPVCLERLDQDTGGILTTLCNHSFHCSCISNWADSSCPVCRYCQQQPENSVCCVCQTSENLWMCVICGFVGCGRYKGGHAIRHWEETEHCYSLELETQRVWDYAGDNYVHRLIQSKTDGKLVELNTHCSLDDDSRGSCEFSDSGITDALLNSKVELIIGEYNELLHAQLENQKQYFEKLLQDVKEEAEKKVSEAVSKAIGQRLQKLQAKLDRCVQDKKFLDELNENLVKNKDIWKAKITELEEREKRAVKAKDEKIEDLEEQLRNLMAQMEEEQPSEEVKEGKDGTVIPISANSSS